MTTHPSPQPPTDPADAARVDGRRTVPPAKPPPLGAPDAAWLAWLRSVVGPDGTLRVSRLVVPDEAGNDAVVLQHKDLCAEVRVAIPSPRGESNDITIYAASGEPNDPDAEPALGVSIAVAGNEVAAACAVLDRTGGWQFHVATPDSAEANVPTR